MNLKWADKNKHANQFVFFSLSKFSFLSQRIREQHS